MSMPRLMRKRHLALEATLALLKRVGHVHLFGANQTNHASLKLRWIRDYYSPQIVHATSSQIVIAEVDPGQTTRAHFHEVGASSFMPLGQAMEMPDPTGLIYRSKRPGDSERRTLALMASSPIQEILPMEIHQFVNSGENPAHILIVVNPVIHTREDTEDIYFVDTF